MTFIKQHAFRLMCLGICAGATRPGLTISPIPDTVYCDSTVRLAWATPPGTVLDTTALNLYQSGQLRFTLGITHTDARTFAWHVAPQAPTGGGYYVRVSCTTANGTSASIDSNTFRIASMDRFNAAWFLFLLLMIPVCVCMCRRKRHVMQVAYAKPLYDGGGSGEAPRAHYCTNPCRGGGSSSGIGTGTAALGGFVAGVAVDEMLHTGGGGHGGGGFGGGDFGGGDFGGGDFGGGDFGGGGGDGVFS